MKTLFVPAGVMVVLFLAAPNKIEAQKRKPARLIEGAISKFECGDNCYLTIIGRNGPEHTGLCLASICNAWTAVQTMPPTYKGRRVRATLGKGKQYDGAGNVMGTTDAFTRIQFIKSEPVEAQERRPDACTFCGVWKYVDDTLNGGGSRHYLKIVQAGAGKLRLIEGFESQGEISWQDYFMYKGNLSGFNGVMVKNADGIYLRPMTGKLVGTFVSPNFRATHGAEFTYKITCELKSKNNLFYFVWDSITGKTDKYVATKISD